MLEQGTVSIKGHTRQIMLTNTYETFEDVYVTMRCICHNRIHGERSIRKVTQS